MRHSVKFLSATGKQETAIFHKAVDAREFAKSFSKKLSGEFLLVKGMRIQARYLDGRKVQGTTCPHLYLHLYQQQA